MNSNLTRNIIGSIVCSACFTLVLLAIQGELIPALRKHFIYFVPLPALLIYWSENERKSAITTSNSDNPAAAATPPACSAGACESEGYE